MIERRRFPRYDCSFKVTYATEGVTSLSSQVTADDVSKVGIRIPVSRIVKRGDIVRLDINAGDDRSSIPALGKVRWTKESRSYPYYNVDAGIEFTDIDPSDVDKLLLMCL